MDYTIVLQEISLYLKLILMMNGAIVGGGCAYIVFEFIKYRKIL